MDVSGSKTPLTRAAHLIDTLMRPIGKNVMIRSDEEDGDRERADVRILNDHFCMLGAIAECL